MYWPVNEIKRIKFKLYPLSFSPLIPWFSLKAKTWVWKCPDSMRVQLFFWDLINADWEGILWRTSFMTPETSKLTKKFNTCNKFCRLMINTIKSYCDSVVPKQNKISLLFLKGKRFQWCIITVVFVWRNKNITYSLSLFSTGVIIWHLKENNIVQSSIMKLFVLTILCFEQHVMMIQCFF